jgi:hypothetical protein
MFRILVFLLLIAGPLQAGVWGLPRYYVVEDMTAADQEFIRATFDEIAREHSLKDRTFMADELATFAYYTCNAGTIQARKSESRAVINTIFLAKEKILTEAIDASIRNVFSAHFGVRFKSP